MDDVIREFIWRMWEPVKGTSSRTVHASDAAHAMGIPPGYDEYERITGELEREGYLIPATNSYARSMGQYQITDEGIREAEVWPRHV
jgi:hypothetical protein